MNGAGYAVGKQPSVASTMNSLGATNAFKELMLLNCGVEEDSWKSLGLQGDPTVHPKGDQSQVFIGGTDAEAETPILWPPDAKSWLIWKDPDAGKDWRRQEKGTEDEMVGWHHRLKGQSGDGLGGLVCCSPRGCKESDMTELTEWTNAPTTNSTTHSVAVSYSLSALPTYSYPWNVFVIMWV